jgi:hypothetical protein
MNNCAPCFAKCKRNLNIFSDNARARSLADQARHEDALFDEFDSRYYKSTEVIDVMVMRYVLKYPDAFR